MPREKDRKRSREDGTVLSDSVPHTLQLAEILPRAEKKMVDAHFSKSHLLNVEIKRTLCKRMTSALR